MLARKVALLSPNEPGPACALLTFPGAEFLKLDLTQSFSIRTGLNLTTAGSTVPWQVVPSGNDLYWAAGGVFTDPKKGKIYFYDGQRTRNGRVNDKSSLTSFDIKTERMTREAEWAQDDAIAPHRYSRGSSLDLPHLGLGLYVGGARIFDGGASNQNWVYPADKQLMTMQLGDGKWSRNWGSLANNKKTIGAAVAWLPVGGKKGILVMIHGTSETERVWISTWIE